MISVVQVRSLGTKRRVGFHSRLHKVETKLSAVLCSLLDKSTASHLSFLKNSVPCICWNEDAFPYRLSAQGHFQLLKAPFLQLQHNKGWSSPHILSVSNQPLYHLSPLTLLPASAVFKGMGDCTGPARKSRIISLSCLITLITCKVSSQEYLVSV